MLRQVVCLQHACSITVVLCIALRLLLVLRCDKLCTCSALSTVVFFYGFVIARRQYKGNTKVNTYCGVQNKMQSEKMVKSSTPADLYFESCMVTVLYVVFLVADVWLKPCMVLVLQGYPQEYSLPNKSFQRRPDRIMDGLVWKQTPKHERLQGHL